MAGVIRGPQDLEPTFAALVEEAFFVRLGVANPAVTDYLTRLLVTHLQPDARFPADRLAHQHIADVTDTLAHQLPDPPPDDPLTHHKAVFTQAGDFVLFWTGMYPENVPTLNANAQDPMSDFCTHGRRFYRHAAELTDDRDQPAPALLAFLADAFDLCTHGLLIVRRGFEQLRKAG